MRKSYEGASIAVSFDSEICQHSGECVRGLPAVFDAKRRPWIDPGGADPETVAAQVRCCPSGALQFELRDPAGPGSAG